LDTGVVFAAGNFGGGISFVLSLSNVAEEELVEAVGAALDAVNGTVGSADLARGEYSAVARGADAGVVILLGNDSGGRLERPGEEVSESGVLFKSVALSLLDFDSINSGEKTVNGAAEAGWDWELADVASDTALDSSDRDKEAELSELLQQLVTEDDVKDERQYLQKGRIRVNQASWDR
jgi:hypothetical protein